MTDDPKLFSGQFGICMKFHQGFGIFRLFCGCISICKEMFNLLIIGNIEEFNNSHLLVSIGLHILTHPLMIDHPEWSIEKPQIHLAAFEKFDAYIFQRNRALSINSLKPTIYHII